MMNIMPLLKELFLFKIRSRFHSRSTILINTISLIYIFFLYFFIIKKVVYFFYELNENTGIQLIVILFYILVSGLLFLISFVQYFHTYSFQNNFLYYLHLPISKIQLISSRVIMILLSQYILLLFLCTPIFVYIDKFFSPPIEFYFLFLSLSIIIPLVPNALSLTVVFISSKVMKFNSKFKYILFVILCIISLLGLVYLKPVTFLMLGSNYNDFLLTFLNFFSLEQSNIVHVIFLLLLLLIISIAFLFIVTVTGSIYYDFNFSRKGNRKKIVRKTRISLWNSSILFFSIKHEIILLLRRPVLYMKALVTVLATPLICIVIFSYNDQVDLIKSFSRGNTELIFIILVCFSISTIGWNPIALSSFSREKNEIAYKSTMPISIKNTIIAKVLTAWIIFIPAIFLYALIFYMFFNVSNLFILLYILLSLVLSLNGSLLGIIFDVFFPVLLWNEEQELFKGRTAITSFQVFNSLYVVTFYIVSYLLLKFFSVDLIIIFIANLLIMLIVMWYLYKILRAKSSSLFHRLNQYYFKLK
ncbi:hypothetical protein [Peribacillus tepidiphilus]|uniref:hypothetical protein n=1 Tax=Peribacillus tepidiphilus TaxID=2652445 RepID=UPI0012912446|nr:hypothetical protein [Peribacillus tepidiphilus]